MPLSETIVSGRPRQRMAASSSRATRRPESEVSAGAPDLKALKANKTPRCYWIAATCQNRLLQGSACQISCCPSVRSAFVSAPLHASDRPSGTPIGVSNRLAPCISPFEALDFRKPAHIQIRTLDTVMSCPPLESLVAGRATAWLPQDLGRHGLV